MEPILYLVHRIPFPPNKGDKIRSHYLLRFLRSRYRVFLGTFVDQPDDWYHVDTVRAMTAGSHFAPLKPLIGRLRAASGLLTGTALTLPYYRDAGMARWVDATIRTEGIRKAVAFSSPMAQYLVDVDDVRLVADFCDVDSAKWAQYADHAHWPASWIYRREGHRLLAFERAAAARATATTFVSAPEKELFERLAPECAPRLYAVGNGVDTAFFAADDALRSPFASGDVPIVFTGAMDYWPNIDAVTWFARHVLPRVAARCPTARFYVVGMNPAAAVRALTADRRVVVTGTVPDIRAYLQHACVVVVPLRIARGVQNKILEAMAMAKPVVTTPDCVVPLSVGARKCVLVADDVGAFVDRVLEVVSGQAAGLGERARQAICADYAWDASLKRFGELLDGLPGAAGTEDNAPTRPGVPARASTVRCGSAFT